MEGKEDESINIPLICRNLNSNPATDANANNDFNNKVIVIVNVTSYWRKRNGPKKMATNSNNYADKVAMKVFYSII